MPYVNIPPSFMPAAIAKITGKIESEVEGMVLKKVTELSDSVRSNGCPADLGRLRNQINGLNNAVSGLDGKLKKFQALPNKLKPPVNGLKSALKIILAIPIPQAVPPGIGLPINITTKFADILHLIKEFIRQISDDIDGITEIVKVPTFSLNSLTRQLSKLERTLKICELEKALQDKLDSGELTFEQMVALGLISDEGDLVTASLTRRAIDFDSYANLSINGIAEQTGLSPDDVANQLRQNSNFANSAAGGNFLNGQNVGDGLNGQNGGDGTGGANGSGVGGDTGAGIESQLNNILLRLDKSGIDSNIKQGLKDVLDTFAADDDNTSASDDKYFHIGPNGIRYKLDIQIDPQSPNIAPRRFAVAIDPNNVIVLKGPKSFSSSVDILLDEIKFRIDNQLP